MIGDGAFLNNINIKYFQTDFDELNILITEKKN